MFFEPRLNIYNCVLENGISFWKQSLFHGMQLVTKCDFIHSYHQFLCPVVQYSGPKISMRFLPKSLRNLLYARLSPVLVMSINVDRYTLPFVGNMVKEYSPDHVTFLHCSKVQSLCSMNHFLCDKAFNFLIKGLCVAALPWNSIIFKCRWVVLMDIPQVRCGFSSAATLAPVLLGFLKSQFWTTHVYPDYLTYTSDHCSTCLSMFLSLFPFLSLLWRQFLSIPEEVLRFQSQNTKPCEHQQFVSFSK